MFHCLITRVVAVCNVLTDWNLEMAVQVYGVVMIGVCTHYSQKIHNLQTFQ